MTNRIDADPPVTPLTIGPLNCERAIGLTWRWCRDFAKRSGVPIWRADGKSVIPAAAFVVALERAGIGVSGSRHETEIDARAELARRLALPETP